MKVTMSLPCARIRRVPSLVFAALFLSTIGSLHAQPVAGRIEGMVRNATTGNPLNNARIVVEGTTVETFTGENGHYRLADLPPGDVRLRVSYTGMEPQTMILAVAPAGTARRDIELSFPRSQTTSGEKGVVQMDKLLVEATAMSAQAAAINEQKYSPNIKNVVVLDEIGDLGDGNIGE